MDSGKLSDWLQVVGLFSVLGGLVFVGLQLMQDRQIASSDTVVAAANTRMHWAEIIGENPDVWVKGLSGEPLTANEAAHFQALAVAWDLTYYADFNTSQQIGGEVADRWVREYALDLHTYPGLLDWWETYFWPRYKYVSPETADDDPFQRAIYEELRRLQEQEQRTD